jgi:VWFA-related protein
MLKLARFAAAVFLAAALSTIGYAQDEEKVTVSTKLVSVNVSVADSRGRYVPGLGREQFEVYDNDVRRRITHFAAGDTPFSAGIVYDMHGATAERTGAVLDALRRFAGGLRKDDDFFLLVFNERGSAAVEFVPTAAQIRDHLAYVQPKGPNSLYDAVYLAAEKLRSRPRVKKALLIISDGQDHNSRHGYKELRRRVREFDVQLYGIAIADPYAEPRAGYGRWVFEDLTRQTGRRTLPESADAAFGRAALDELVRASGGTSYSPRTESEPELFGICTRIAAEMRRQYTIGFSPTDSPAGATRHKLLVRVKRPDGAGRLRLSYRRSYRLPQGQPANFDR